MYMAYQLIILYLLNGQYAIETYQLDDYGKCLDAKAEVEQSDEPTRIAVTCTNPGYET